MSKVSAMNSCRLAVKVIPGVSRNEICGWLGEILKVKLSASRWNKTTTDYTDWH
jgi:hypothetical protein